MHRVSEQVKKIKCLAQNAIALVRALDVIDLIHGLDSIEDPIQPKININNLAINAIGCQSNWIISHKIG